MVHATPNHQGNELIRRVYPISQSKDFFNNLQYSLHRAVEEIFPFGETKFTIFINVLDRETYQEHYRNEPVNIIYAGVPTQRKIYSKYINIPKKTDLEWEKLDAAKRLKMTATKSESDQAQETQRLYSIFAIGEYSSNNIKVGSLYDYFFKEELDDLQIAEREILSHVFNLHKDKYLTIPLIGFGDYDGAAHIIFESKGESVVNQTIIKQTILRFSTEYEELFLGWSGGIGEKEFSINKFFNEEILNDNFYNEKNKNPILKELGYPARYRKYSDYYNERLERYKIIPQKLYLQYLRQAITSILIDSYAHNISAHSLTALAWWFQKRANMHSAQVKLSVLAEWWAEVDKLLAEGDEGLGSEAVKDIDKLLRQIRDKMDDPGLATRDKEEGSEVVHFPGHLSRELHPLFRFLMEKGAYWSGITRDQNIGGKVSSLFSVLWYNFINNPLYLGTIAKTEDIQCIRLEVTVYEEEEFDPAAPVKRQKKIIDQGTFAIVDLRKARTKFDEKEEDWLRTRSIFVEPGKDFGRMKHHLEKARIYFPGGVVGKHAFFTMLENEIRNVKHYYGEALKEMQYNGLKLNISIQSCWLPGRKGDESQLYRIGIGIGTPITLAPKGQPYILKAKWKSLNSELTETLTHVPKLGGTYQDKICAAMFFNGSFSSVQNGYPDESRSLFRDTERDKAFFPWAVPVCRPINEADQTHHIVYEASVQNKEYVDDTETSEFPETGYLEKHFYAWKGANIFSIKYDKTEQGNKDDAWENYSRFKIVTIPSVNADAAMLQLRKEGVVRVIEDWQPGEQKDDKDDFLKAYRIWLRKWIGVSEYAILLQDNGINHALLALNQYECHAYSAEELSEGKLSKEVTKQIALATSNERDCVLPVAHRGEIIDGPSTLRYRTHGTYKTYFLNNNKTFKDTIQNHRDRLFELYEILATRICVFDNRIWHRIREEFRLNGGPERRKFFEEKLKITTHAEGTIEGHEWHDNWDIALNNVVPKCHFLILHLSFIERVLQKKYADAPGFSQGNIGLFIERELLEHIIDEEGKVRENFFLVVTTGRGRSDWLESLKTKKEYEEYFRFTIFRPVESLISAMETSLALKDDIELKYRLCKVLFGS
jgi:hypothetical protein